jgi:hypothetical protein
MTPSEFKRSLASKQPPSGLSPALTALWWAGNDKWDKAHEIVMNKAIATTPVIGTGRPSASRLPAALPPNGR